MRLAFLYGDFKALEIDLPHGPFADPAVGVITIRLLIVSGKMLDGGAAAGVFLHAPGDGGGKAARDQRVLGEILKVSTAADIPVDVQRRGQPQMYAEALHLVAHDIAAGFGQIDVPALRDRRADGDGCAVLLTYFSLGLAAAAHELYGKGHHAGHQLHHALLDELTHRMRALLVHGVLAAQTQPGRAVRHNERGDALVLQTVDRLARGACHALRSAADHAQTAHPAAEGADIHQRQLLVGEGRDHRVNFMRQRVVDCFRLDRRGLHRNDRNLGELLRPCRFRLPVGKVRLAEAVFDLA